MTPVPNSNLPVEWPYPARAWEGNWGELAEQRLPSLGSGWTLRICPGSNLEDEPVPLSGALGRGGVFRVGEVVLRPYRRGGWVRFLNRSTYSGIQRFQNEFAVHARLFREGFPTVEPVGYAFRRRGLGWQGVFLTRWSQGVPWPADWSKSSTILPALGMAIRALAAAGYWAPDLNATNVLVTAGGELRLLDWDRTSPAAPETLLPAYQARMLRSLQKLEAPADVVREFQELF